ncbi:MAG: bifunctional 2-C-methyl-D-erythritol 4-phosphate cytidylyltransferase/2-C-methyl-D-erythritol 2,4-cyclodiphosphate synthase [Pseudorhodoplanes sp.]|nr:bifunctional 2-C-methyl-D-erythritol 4-phosphate cytidylyltransferase/2-C-methyl-D-erythritol 2,4-cyclodiphosphate synthase [Pseudorhodoplanes sp.]
MPQKVAVLVLAAGRGTRSGGGVPKQYRPIGGRPVIRASLEIFGSHPRIGTVQPVVHADDEALFVAAVAGLRVQEPVIGGATRQASVLAGLAALETSKPDIVLVHDAARPFLSSALVDRAIDAAAATGAAIPALPVTDTVKVVDGEGRVTQTIDRAALRTVQTPQAFDFQKLLAAHRRAAESSRQDFTDDAALAEWAGLTVTTFEGESRNMKLTTAEDFAKLEEEEFARLPDIRTGMGFDVHAFGPGDHVTLGGVRIAHDQAITGHSDADVALHALVDAILGALADGDIGSHFPPSDPQWRGASSDRFLRFAVERVAARGGRIAHLDVSIVCEAPKIGPHRDAIRQRIAGIAGVTVDRVAVKATTNEQLGFIGRREGIVAYATATVRLPWSGGHAR